MDLASFIGIFSGLALIISAILMGGNPENFISGSGIMIVLGGTIATTLLTFPFKDVVSAFRAAYFVFIQKKTDPNNVMANMIKLCMISRRQGLLELSKVRTSSRFLKKACGLIADGSEMELIRDTLSTEIESLKMRHFIIQDVFKKMGTYAPAFGMLGTLIGLVQMLSQLSDPSRIGPAMAVALLTTFYGSLLSTLIFLPIAAKLRSRTIHEVLNMEIMHEGCIAIMDSNNPLIVYERLSSFIPTNTRKSMTSLNIK